MPNPIGKEVDLTIKDRPTSAWITAHAARSIGGWHAVNGDMETSLFWDNVGARASEAVASEINAKILRLWEMFDEDMVDLGYLGDVVTAESEEDLTKPSPAEDPTLRQDGITSADASFIAESGLYGSEVTGIAQWLVRSEDALFDAGVKAEKKPSARVILNERVVKSIIDVGAKVIAIEIGDDEFAYLITHDKLNYGNNN